MSRGFFCLKDVSVKKMRAHLSSHRKLYLERDKGRIRSIY